MYLRDLSEELSRENGLNYLSEELHLNAIVYLASIFKLTAGSFAVQHRRLFAHRNYFRSNLGIISGLRINK